MISVFARTLGTIFRSFALICLYVSIATLVVAVTLVLTGTLALKPVAASDPASPAIGVILGISGSTAAFVSGGLAFTVLFGSPLTRDQASGRIATVVASPVGARGTWIARSLALWAVATIGTLASAGTAVVALHEIWAHAYPLSELDGHYLVLMLVLIPLLLLGMALVVTALGVTVGPVPGTVAANICYIGIATTMGRLAGSGTTPAWYAGVFAILAAGLLLAGIVASVFVTRERMVLACQ